MKNKTKVYIIFLLMLASNLLFFNTVQADTYYNVGFESGTVGDEQYTESIAYFDNSVGDAEIDDSPTYSGSRSWNFHYAHSGDDDFYVNLSSTVNYISWYWSEQGAGFGTASFRVRCFNSDDTEIIRLNWDNIGHRLQNEDHEGNDLTVSPLLSNDDWDFFSITVMDTDEIYFSGVTDAGVWKNATDTPYVIDDNYNISYIKFDGASQSSNDWIHFDNFQFGEVETEGSTSTCGFESISINQPTSVELGSLVRYNVTLTGEVGSEFYMEIRNESNELVYTHYRTLTSTTQTIPLNVYYPYEFGNGTYTLNINDYFFIPCDGIYDYVLSDTFEVFWYEGLNESVIIEQYGNGEESFIEFYGYNEPCRYSMNTQPVIVWYLNSTDFAGYDYAHITIWSRNDEGSNTAYFLDFHDGFTTDLLDQVIVKSLGRRFQENDDYIIRVYKSNNESIIDPYDPVAMSNIVYVCRYDDQQDWDGDGIPNWQDDDADGDGILDDWTDNNNNGINDADEIELLPTLNQPLGSIVGFIIVGFTTLMPFIIAGSIGKTIGSNIQVPPLVYGFFGALGISISVIMGLFPTWIVFFIVAVGVIIVALTYLLNLRQQGVV